LYVESEVLPPGWRSNYERRSHLNLLDDVTCDAWWGCGCEGHHRDAEALFKPTECSISWPKIVSPLRDAVGFIYDRP
tara:strand:+ start:233 stop:463 length:231 start_codon:yes stop_codon:yes gene_type:complete